MIRLLISIFLILSASCSTSAVDASKKEIRIALATEPPTLDWNLATDNVSYQILNQLMEGLTQYDQNLNPIPAIAQKWEVSEDGKTYTFFLNQDYKWSDGKPVTAHDFRYSWLRLLNPKTAAEYAYFLFDIIGAQEFNSGLITKEAQVGIDVIDPWILRVRLNKPIVFFPSITTFMVTYPLRQDLIEKYGDQWTNPKNILTCGPFILKEWWHEYRLQLIANPNYGGQPKPSLDQITIFLINDPSTVLSLYELGYLDTTRPPPLALPKYKNHPQLMRLPQLRGYYYGFNIRKKPFDDVRIRQALAMALDKTELPNILNGGEQPVDSWIPPGLLGYSDQIGISFNPQKAQQLLNEAGFDKDHPFPEVTLSFNSDPTNKKIGEWAQAQWKNNLGINIKLDNQEWKSYLSMLKTDPPSLYRLGWGADYPDPDNFMNLFTSWSGNNHTGWKNDAFDQLISLGAKEGNAEKRKLIYDEAQKLLLEKEAIMIPLFVSTQNILVKPYLKPYPLSPLDFVYYKWVRIKENTKF